MQGTVTKEIESRSCTEECSLENDNSHYFTDYNDGYENSENKIDTEDFHHDKLEREYYHDHETDCYNNCGGGYRKCNIEQEEYDHETEGYSNSGNGHQNCDCDKDDQKYSCEKYDHVEREPKYEKNECGFDDDCDDWVTVADCTISVE